MVKLLPPMPRAAHALRAWDAARSFTALSLGEQHFYIGIMKQLRIHVKSCPEVPEADKDEYMRLRTQTGVMRSRKSAWPDTARAIGLVEMVDENGNPAGLTYLPPTTEE